MGEQRHPRELPILFLTEMWERFSFYLMIGILPLYLTDTSKGGMGWSAEKRSVVVGTYMGLVYFTPFIGGMIADRLLGCRRTILIGGTLMMCGHLALAWPAEAGLYLGLGLIILGNGAFKPNISTLLGNLYPPGSPLKDTGYNIFYMGINIGAFICNFVAALVRNHFDEYPWQITAGWKLAGWHAAFGTAAIGMFLGLVLFASCYRRLARADQQPTAVGAASGESFGPLLVQCLIPAALLAALGFVVAGGLEKVLPDWLMFLSLHDYPGYPEGLKPLTLAFLLACLPVVVFYLRLWRNVPSAADRGRVAALLVIAIIVIIFWTTYGLNTTALNDWTRDNTVRELTPPVQLITDPIPEFAENAPPEYFFNAAPEAPRPSRQTFEVVSQQKYEELRKADELTPREGHKVPVTQEILDKVYANADPKGPRLEEGKQLKLVNTELFQSINPGLIIIFTPLIVALWHFLRKRGKEPGTPAKMGIGLLLSALAPLIMLGATLVAHDGELKASTLWLFGTYGAVGLGELCLSSMGLSVFNKMSPAAIRASMMGVWFLSTAIGLKISGVFGEVYAEMKTPAEHELFWSVLIAANLGAAAVIFLLLPWLNRQIAGELSEEPHMP
jgi:POT family proton-dependent oligopeptide transporter